MGEWLESRGVWSEAEYDLKRSADATLEKQFPRVLHPTATIIIGNAVEEEDGGNTLARPSFHHRDELQLVPQENRAVEPEAQGLCTSFDTDQSAADVGVREVGDGNTVHINSSVIPKALSILRS